MSDLGCPTRSRTRSAFSVLLTMGFPFSLEVSVRKNPTGGNKGNEQEVTNVSTGRSVPSLLCCLRYLLFEMRPFAVFFVFFRESVPGGRGPLCPPHLLRFSLLFSLLFSAPSALRIGSRWRKCLRSKRPFLLSFSARPLRPLHLGGMRATHRSRSAFSCFQGPPGHEALRFFLFLSLSSSSLRVLSALSASAVPGTLAAAPAPSAPGPA